ncbi:MAG: hypothetical protein IKK06_02060 [Clostridia bacterium]|nr:hypothetical protein [Clostridia bacterium]
MTKKEYCAPALEIVVLEQEDVITASAPDAANKTPVAGTTGNKGVWDTWA